MKTRYSLYMDFVKAYNQAERLEELAAELRQLKDREYSDCMRQITAAWKSENATAFLRKADRVGDRIAVTAEQLRKTAEIIRRIAKRTYDTEMAALERAK